MRTWHRRLSIFVGAFMLVIACTGVWLQVEELLKTGGGPGGPPPPAAVGPGAAPRAIDEAQVQALVAQVLAGARRSAPQGRLLGFDLRLAGPQPMAEVVILDAAGPRRLRLDARSGEPIGAAEGGGLHRLMLELHRGDIVGRSGNWIGLICGAVLAVLSLTGLWLYLQMWRRRSGAKMKGFVW